MEKMDAVLIKSRADVQPETYAGAFLSLYREIKDVQADTRIFDLGLFLAEEFGWDEAQVDFLTREFESAEDVRLQSEAQTLPIEFTYQLIQRNAASRLAAAQHQATS
ncbi:MAG TPA: hypothetical protein VMR34_02330 [Candidatus Saccharimonadales bacterium]|nr:hypothetical protein [Candidatus Saccharimonadales bacterium]